MKPFNKAELLTALDDNKVQIKRTVARFQGNLTDEEWRAAIDRVVELREVRTELEAKLAALK
jgi:hypothetical protein